SDRPNASVCHEDSGACVQCTKDDESPCGDYSCDPVAFTCTETERGKTGTCRPCLADSECEGDRRCIELKFQGEPHGWYCMLQPPPMGGCVGASPAPWKVPLLNRPSRSGEEPANYCGINEALTTCEAVHAAREGQSVDCQDDSECPRGGLCRLVGPAGVGTNRCTYACEETFECPSTGGLASCPEATE